MTSQPPDNVARWLQSHPDWTVDGKCLVRTAQSPSYSEALGWVTRIALAAEVDNHHPDLEWTYTTVRIRLTTHDADGLTELDLRLAEKVDGILGTSDGGQ